MIYKKQQVILDEKDYYKIMKPWKNTVEQRYYILNYDYD